MQVDILSVKRGGSTSWRNTGEQHRNCLNGIAATTESMKSEHTGATRHEHATTTTTMNTSNSGSVLGDYPVDSKAHVRAVLDRAQQQRREDASSHHHRHHHPYDHDTTSRHDEGEHSRRRYGDQHAHDHEAPHYGVNRYPPYQHHYHQQRAYEGEEECDVYDPRYRRSSREEAAYDAAYDHLSYTRRSAATTSNHRPPTRSSAHADTKPRSTTSWDDDDAYYPPLHVPAADPILSSPLCSSHPSRAPLSEGLPPRRSSSHHPLAYPQSHNYHYDHHQEHSSYDHHHHENDRHQYAHYKQHHHEYDGDDGEQHRRVVKHEPPRARNKHHAAPQVALPSSSSYRSTSNSSIPDEDDGPLRDDDEDYDDDDDADLNEDDDEEDDDMEDLSPHERLSQLTPEMYEDSELHSDARHMLHMLIPASAMGCLIGSRGAIIRQLNAQTKCTLSVRDANAFSVKDDRVLRVYGKPKGICLAQHLVIEKIRAHRAKKGDPNYIALDLDDDELVLPLPESSVTKSMAVAVSRPNPNQKQKSATTVSDARIGSVTWLLPLQDVGKILGQRGAILSAIARDTRTKIHITPIAEMARGSTERAVTISGSPDGVETARQAIEAKAGGRPEDPGFNGKCGQYFAIPYTSAGALIGLQGATVKQIAEKTGARLQIPSSEDLPLGIVNRTLHIQGNKQQVEAAHAIACRKVRKELQEQAVEASEIVPDITIKILLPTRIAGFLLEQHGRLIREISEKSGAHAHFLPPHDDDTRLCAIKGEMSRVFRAERLILQFIAGDAIATKRSGGSGDTVVLSVPRERKQNKRRQREDSDVDFDDDDDMEESGVPTRKVRGTAGRPTNGATKRMRIQSNDRRTNKMNASTDNRRVRLVPSMARGTKQNGRANERLRGNNGNLRGGEAHPPKVDILDRLQAPLQSSRHSNSVAQNTNKRQRKRV
ncbi:Far upstream element-binding protein 3-like, partial [Globisporangium splendens]